MWIAAGLVAAATIYAVIDGKVANLLIGAAMVATSAALFGYQMDRRVGDFYDSGKKAQRRASVPAVEVEPTD